MDRKLNPKKEEIPGLRSATEDEKVWIANTWGKYNRHWLHPMSGRTLSCIGWCMVFLGVVHLLDDFNFVSAVVLFAVAAFCFFFANVGKHSYLTHLTRAEDLETGNYRVVHAYATETGAGDGVENYWAKVELEDGTKLSSIYSMMPEFARKYPCKKSKLPILLIRMPDGYILTIPRQEVWSHVV